MQKETGGVKKIVALRIEWSASTVNDLASEYSTCSVTVGISVVSLTHLAAGNTSDSLMSFNHSINQT